MGTFVVTRVAVRSVNAPRYRWSQLVDLGFLVARVSLGFVAILGGLAVAGWTERLLGWPLAIVASAVWIIPDLGT